jgi:hypothetical protein
MVRLEREPEDLREAVFHKEQAHYAIPAFQRISAHQTSPHEAGLVFERAHPKLAVYTHIVRPQGESIGRFALNAVAVEGPRGALTFATVAESEGQRNAIYCKCPEQPR